MTLDDIKARCDEVGECWIWKKSLQAGVPAIRIPTADDPKRPLVNVRRWIAVQQGKKVDGLFATTKCGDPLCVNPEHVVLMTRKQLGKRAGATMSRNENPARRAKRAAARIRRGDIKVGPEIARQIRSGDKTTTQWAEELGCSRKTIWLVLAGKTWIEHNSPFAGLIR